MNRFCAPVSQLASEIIKILEIFGPLWLVVVGGKKLFSQFNNLLMPLLFLLYLQPFLWHFRHLPLQTQYSLQLSLHLSQLLPIQRLSKLIDRLLSRLLLLRLRILHLFRDINLILQRLCIQSVQHILKLPLLNSHLTITRRLPHLDLRHL